MNAADGTAPSNRTGDETILGLAAAEILIFWF